MPKYSMMGKKMLHSGALSLRVSLSSLKSSSVGHPAGLIAGGLTFVVINTALDSWVAQSAGDPLEVPTPSSEAAENICGAEAEQTERV